MPVVDFVEKYLLLARDLRGLSPRNSITFNVVSGGATFKLVVGYVEPSGTTLPENVLWIPVHPDDPDYLKLLRRTNATPNSGTNHVFTYEEITDDADIFSDPQTYGNVPDKIIGEIESFVPRFASASRYGGFTTSFDNPPDTVANTRIVVGDNDPRMSDARTPKAHDHYNGPRTMLSTGDGETTELNGETVDNYVAIATVNDPTRGDILDIVGELDDGTFIARWNKPSLDFEYLGPTPVSLAISGPNDPIQGGTATLLAADVTLSSSEVLQDVDAIWSITSGASAGFINAETGMFTAYDITADVDVTVRAVYLHQESGQTVNNTFTFTVEGNVSAITLVSLAIVAPTDVSENSAAFEVEVFATLSDNSVVKVTPTSLTHSNNTAGTLSGVMFTPASNVTSDLQTVFTASYTYQGVTRGATHTLTVVDTTLYPETLEISGPSSVNQNSTGHQYTAQVTLSNGNTVAASPVTWGMVSSANATINSSGVLTTNAIDTEGNRSATITASYTLNGQTVQDTFTVTIVDTVNWPRSAAISGPTEVQESAQGEYTYSVTYKNNAVVQRTPSWSLSVPAAGSIDAAGVFTAADVSEATNLSVQATYAELGIELNATKDITVTLDAASIVPVSLDVTGTTSVDEGDQATYTATATFSDTSSNVVTPTWSVSPAGAGSISAAGVFTAADVSVNTPAVISASYTNNGETVTDTLNITVIASTAPAQGVARYGVGMFSNVNFTGGPLEVSTEEAEYDVSMTLAPNGTPYEHWTGLDDFVQSVMTTEFTPGTVTTPLTASITQSPDFYVYIMWPVADGDLKIKDANNFDVEFIGINWRNDWLPNEDGFPNYDPSLLPYKEVTYQGVLYRIVRQESPVMNPNTTLNWKFYY